jgi:hypothetical protein
MGANRREFRKTGEMHNYLNMALLCFYLRSFAVGLADWRKEFLEPLLMSSVINCVLACCFRHCIMYACLVHPDKIILMTEEFGNLVTVKGWIYYLLEYG